MQILVGETNDNQEVVFPAQSFFSYYVFDADFKNGETNPILKSDIKKIIGEIDERSGEIIKY